MSTLVRQRFFDKTVHHPAWKDAMSGENEERALTLFDAMGYKLNKDFVRQHPIGERFVIDFAFVNEQVAIEIDGKSHLAKKQMKMDDSRDMYLRHNNWIPIRIQDSDLFGYKMSFYKNLIKDIVGERRKQWEIGQLYEIEIPNYKDEDYE